MFGLCVQILLCLAAHSRLVHSIPLTMKLSGQGTGFAKILDVGTGAVIVIYHLIALLTKWRSANPGTITSLLFGFAFSLLAVQFHNHLDETGIEPEGWYFVVFCFLGGMTLYCYADVFGNICGPNVAREITFAKTQCVLIMTMPAILWISDMETLLNDYTYNGYIFVHVSFTVYPFLDAAHRYLRLQTLYAAKLMFPGVVVLFLIENFSASAMAIDTHVTVHIGALSFIAALNHALANCPKCVEKDGKRGFGVRACWLYRVLA